VTPSAHPSLRLITQALEKNCFASFLLHGITGSGKTEVYLAAAAEALRLGRQSLILVPEIALTAQIEGLFRQRFQSRVAILHSGLGSGELVSDGMSGCEFAGLKLMWWWEPARHCSHL
jgi:primosomal protein N' (replication factor Y)